MISAALKEEALDVISSTSDDLEIVIVQNTVRLHAVVRHLHEFCCCSFLSKGNAMK